MTCSAHQLNVRGVCEKCGICFHTTYINGTCSGCGKLLEVHASLLTIGAEETILALRKALHEKTQESNRFFEAKRITAVDHAKIRSKNQEARAVLKDHKRPALERISAALRILEE